MPARSSRPASGWKRTVSRRRFFEAVVSEALAKNLCSEHFSVDGTLIESFASAKSFQPQQEQDDRPQDEQQQKKPSTKKPPKQELPRDSNGFKPSNPDVDFHGQQRTNATHASKTAPEARLYRKGRGKEAQLSHLGHVLSENRHGLILRVAVTEANGEAELKAATDMLDVLKAKHPPSLALPANRSRSKLTYTRGGCGFATRCRLSW